MYRLCESCLKRLGLQGKPERCELCGDIFKKIDDLLNFTYTAEFSNFNIGIKLDPNVLEKEKKIVEMLNLSGEKTLKRELLSIFRKKLREKLNKEVELEYPDVIFVFDLEKCEVIPESNPLYIKGRYNKYVRYIPQTKWYCRKCRGKGCPYCNFEGKMYETSVEEIIGEVILRYTKAQGEKFHGAGREDIDAKMLGNGRPFVIEIQKSEVRTLNLEKIQNEINKDRRIKVSELEYSNKREVIRLKREKFKKTYLVYLDQEISNEEFAKLKDLCEINQRTPRRVQHRRADKTRIRKVYKVEKKNNNCLKICCESGLYVKELITGDDGRTVPSVSSIVQKDVKCIALDVIKIHDR
ncbi:MAG: tRNA pseudouridine(54/55) synthase Pus10 [Methanomicrobia archaeon]|nr:tRNA pseudouridine(54/55) synthase Pus10 [Methanomicrobia archaeon]